EIVEKPYSIALVIFLAQIYTELPTARIPLRRSHFNGNKLMIDVTLQEGDMGREDKVEVETSGPIWGKDNPCSMKMLHTAWIVAENVPEELQNYQSICEIGSMIGVVEEVDLIASVDIHGINDPILEDLSDEKFSRVRRIC
ncbi:hypothetical protein ACJX0J_019501, partial [Zea mays]